jgi:hypothetical protein
MNIRTLTWVFAAVFIVVGLVGVMTEPGALMFGLFEVDMLHNLTHIISGAVFALVGVGLAGQGKEKYLFQVFGLLYALVALVGFIQGYTVAGLFGVNLADNALHAVIALVALAIGFLGKKTSPVVAATKPVSGGPGTL